MRKVGITEFATGLLILVTIFCSAVYGDQGAELMNAAKEGDLKQVRDLLDNGADVDTKDDSGVSALLAAAVNGHIEVVKLLLESEANVDAKDNNGVTTLMVASHEGHIDIVKLLRPLSKVTLPS